MQHFEEPKREIVPNDVIRARNDFVFAGESFGWSADYVNAWRREAKDRADACR